MEIRTQRSPLGLRLLTGAAAGLLFGATLALGAADARAADGPLCGSQDAKLAATGKGDSDHDGLSNCREKLITGTSAKNADTDDDGVMDGTEVSTGTDPLDADSDHDGLDDGQEMIVGSDPQNADTDDDGLEDGQDADANGVLESKIVGPLDSVTCPPAADASLTVLGIAIMLTPDTRYDEGSSCADLAAPSAVEVKVTGALNSFVAIGVSVEDGDNDGTPDDIEVP
jgi:hypothetical protein